MFKGYEDLAAFHEANVNAALRGSEAIGRGADDVRVAVVSIIREAGDSAVSAAVAAKGCQGVGDILTVHGDLARGFFETCLTQCRRIAEVQRNTVETALGSFSERVAASVEVLARSRAA